MSLKSRLEINYQSEPLLDRFYFERESKKRPSVCGVPVFLLACEEGYSQ